MNTKQTWCLVGTALVLLAFILLFERHQPDSVERRLPPKLLPGIELADITAIEVSFPGSTASTRAEQSEGVWRLTKPAYPAQQTAVEAFAATLHDLRRLDKIAPHDVLVQGTKSFGFEPPGATVRVQEKTNVFTLHVGGPTPLTNNVYVKIEGVPEVFVTDGRLLQALPKTSDAWRSAALVDLERLNFDRLQIRSGQRLLELERNATNNLWQISRPTPARADQARIVALFQELRRTQVNDFVTDSPTADLERFGLQSPELELAFAQGTNRIFTLEFGVSPTNFPSQVFARRLATTNVVLVNKELAEFLRQPYKAFHDPHLLSFNPEALDQITVNSIEDFALQRQPDRGWIVRGSQTNHADPGIVSFFITNLLILEIVDFAKEVPTEADLKEFGFTIPTASFTLSERSTNPAGIITNVVYELTFGTNQTDRIYAKRSDETPVYITPLAQMLVLPRWAYELRDRRIWDFAPANVSNVTVSTQQLSKVYQRDPTTSWTPDPIRNAAMEEAVFRLGRLISLGWLSKGKERLPVFGITENSFTLTIAATIGDQDRKFTVRFGSLTPRGNVYATVVLPGDTEPVIFEFAGGLYQELLQNFVQE